MKELLCWKLFGHYVTWSVYCTQQPRAAAKHCKLSAAEGPCCTSRNLSTIFQLTCASDNRKLLINLTFPHILWSLHTQNILIMVRYIEWHIYNRGVVGTLGILTLDKAPSDGRHSTWNLNVFLCRNWRRACFLYNDSWNSLHCSN